MIILGIDQAATSGWCIVERDAGGILGRHRALDHGTCRRAIERREIIARAVAVAQGPDRLVAVYEQHGVGRSERWTPATMIGVGDSRGRWLEALELADVPRRHCIGVPPAEWRRAMIGPRRLDRAQWKAQAVLSCRGRGVTVTDDDEAEAVLIALWAASCSDEVARMARRAA